MANYVKNMIHFSMGTYQKKIDELFQTVIVTDENNKLRFDFNKLIPMPESLNIESGSRTGQAMKLYRAVQLSQERVDEDKKELYALGEIACKNMEQYGFSNWYGWRIENWGTKWNSMEQF